MVGDGHVDRRAEAVGDDAPGRLELTRIRTWTGRLGRFVNRTWPWLPLTLLGLALLNGAASIATQKPEPDVDRINHAVHDFGEAAKGRRGDEACSHLTANAQRQVTSTVPGVPCALAIRSFGVAFDPGALQGSILTQIRVTGDRATMVLLDYKRRPLGISVSMKLVGGDWKLDDIRQRS